MSEQPTTADGFSTLPSRTPHQYQRGTNPYEIYDQTVTAAQGDGFPAPKITDVNSTAGKPGFDGAPTHYKTAAGIQSFDVIDAYGLTFYDGNAWKYLTRWDKKGNGRTDLEKSAHYLQESLTRAPRTTEEFFRLEDIDLKPDVVLTAFGFTPNGLLWGAAHDLLLSRTTPHPQTYLRSALSQVAEYLIRM